MYGRDYDRARSRKRSFSDFDNYDRGLGGDYGDVGGFGRRGGDLGRDYRGWGRQFRGFPDVDAFGPDLFGLGDFGFGRGLGLPDFGRYDWDPLRDLGREPDRRYLGLTYPQQTPTPIGEAGLDLGYPRTGGKAEKKYRKLPDYPKVEENPNIDDTTLWRPRADIFDEGPDRLRIEFELPGVPKEDISLTVQDDVITLAALKPQTRKEETGFHYQTERHFGKFYRRLVLPYAVDADNVRAHLEHGVLKVHLIRKGGQGRVAIGETGTTGSA